MGKSILSDIVAFVSGSKKKAKEGFLHNVQGKENDEYEESTKERPKTDPESYEEDLTEDEKKSENVKKPRVSKMKLPYRRA